jgi:tetratricopeptide (TPR) repeat protein
VLSRRKKIVFSLVPALLIVLSLVVAELFLRHLSPSTETEIVSEVRYDGIEWYKLNRSYLAKYFPPGPAALPEFKPALFRKVKLPGSFRVFCLGESSMFGTPYEMNASIPGILRKELRRALPGREIEVVNFGASAINSNVIADMAPQLIRFRPDCVIIYTGHNEYYGPDGVGANFIEKWFPRLTGLKYDLKSLRLVQLLGKLAGGIGGKEKPSGEQNLMKQVSSGQLVHSGSSDDARVMSNFRRNLGTIITIFREQNIPVVISDVSSNLLFPPFVTDSTGVPGELLGAAAAADDKLDPLAEKISDVLKRDSTNALANYLEGRVLLHRGDTASARSSFVRARDNDLLKFRAPSGINDIIRQTADSARIPFFSSDSLFSAASPGHLPGNLVFWEHLHPTVYGYYLVANRFSAEILRDGLAGQPVPVANIAPPPFSYDSLGLAWLDIAYADRSIRHLTGRWPFSGYHRDAVVLDTAGADLQALVEDVYARRITWDDGCYKSAIWFWRHGRLADARLTYEAMLEDYPYNFYVNYLLANLLVSIHEYDHAVAYYIRSITSNPSYPNSRTELGMLQVNRGEFPLAISQLDTARMLLQAGNNVIVQSSVYYGLSAAYANIGRIDTALALIDKSLRLNPSNQDAIRLRNQLGNHR